MIDYNARLDAIIERELAKVRADILKWGKYYFPEKFTVPFCHELHDYFVEIKYDPFTSTLAPRGTAKTTIKCFLIPFYLALEKPHLFQHYMNVQATATKAVAINVAIKTECEENEELINDYGIEVEGKEGKTLMGSKWTENQFVLANGVVFSCLGANQSVRGVNYRSRRPDYIVVDDLYDEEDINNPRSIKKKEDWFWGSLYPCRAKHKKHCVHVQGTAIHNTDLMHKLAERSRWKSKKFQAIKNNDTKEVLWSENPAYTYDALMLDKEDMGSIIFEREFQNNCRDDESAIIKQSWIRLYKHSEFLQTKLKIIKTISGLDPATGENALKNNDYTGVAHIHVDENYNIYIEAVAEERVSFNSSMNLVENWHDRFDPQIFAIEAIAGFKLITGEVRRTKNVRLKEITSVKDKIARLEAQSFRWENGKVFINSEMPKNLLNTLIDQLINNYPAHDDVRDAVIIAMEQIVKSSGVRASIM